MDTRAQVAVVTPNKINFGERFREDYGDLEGLAADFKRRGIITPLAVSKLESSDNGYEYDLLAGGRRFKAIELAGIMEVPIRIYPADITEIERREIELSENMWRKDLTWQERDNLIAQIHDLQIQIHGRDFGRTVATSTSTNPTDKQGWNQTKTAELLGLTPSAVSESIKRNKVLQTIPEVAKCKTADEASKTISIMTQKVLVGELAKRQQTKVAETSIDRTRADLVNRYIIGDFFEGVKRIPDNSVDLCEVDPPYSIALKDMKKKIDSTSLIKFDDYNEISEDIYPEFLLNTVLECYRILKPTGWIVFWFAPEPWFESVYQVLRKVGFTGNRLTGKWLKPNGQTLNPEIYLGNQIEDFFYMRKGSGVIQNQRKGNVFEYPTIQNTKKIHPTERPIEMISDIMHTFCLPGANIVIPFLGSGNSILAASNRGMSAIGWDIGSSFKDNYTLKVHSGKPGEYTSYM